MTSSRQPSNAEVTETSFVERNGETSLSTEPRRESNSRGETLKSNYNK